MRTLVKGGVWKNTEDEILKAAVSKYGKNQWARISSLLVRKTPKQCKARWFDWLDPSIKKTEWAKEEDEKLLHLAKLMPTQWRTIAPIVGRTPAQCLERYQRLLDEAEAKDHTEGDELGLTGPTGRESGPSADDVRKLRPGEIDPDPEVKPARPDPVDMDEDEKEMLSEARARLANTQGKKAKRKARERQLEEARRLATLQKRRELKAAGIELKPKKKKKKASMDYNEDIPFEKLAPLGFYDVTEERNQAPEADKFVSTELSKVNRRRADIEEEKQQEKKRKEKDKPKNESDGNPIRFVRAHDAKILKIQEQEQIAKRRKLMLPSPQVGEQELAEIVKAGFAGESAKSLVQGEEDETATYGLLSDYAVTPGTYTVRTPMATAASDTLAMEARNLRALTAAQTPLLGEENAALLLGEGTGFESAMPRHSALQTPNPLATPLRGADGSSTSGGQTPYKTPLRDNFNINERGMMMGGTPREVKMLRSERKRSLRESLRNLPQPQNEVEIQLPDMESETEEPEANELVEDMSEKEKKKKEAEAREEKERQARRSSAVQRKLPRPEQVPKLEADIQDEVERMVYEEYVRLLNHDAIKHPVAGSKVAPGTAKLGDLADLEDEFDADALADARLEMDRELRSMLDLAEGEDVQRAIWNRLASLDNFEQTWSEQHDGLVFSAQTKQFMTLGEISDDKERIKGLGQMFKSNEECMVRETNRAEKLVKKLNVRLGRYMQISEELSGKLAESFEELQDEKIKFECYANLQVAERAAIPRRREALQMEVQKLKQRENELQQRYKELSDKKEHYMAGIV